jgi:mannosyl-3-phosphoglycerate phosphatase
LLAPHHLLFTALEGTLLDPRTGSFAEAAQALRELERRSIPVVLLTSRTRAEVEPLRRRLGHGHPFVTENGGGIFVPLDYFNLRIPGARRSGRYLCAALGLPYQQVTAALDEIADESGVAITGFHHMSLREIARNMGLSQPDSELVRNREFDEPFFFISSDSKAIARFVAAANDRGFTARPRDVFWHFSSGCDPAAAVRLLIKLFYDATRTKLHSIGIGSSTDDLPWLRVVDRPILLIGSDGRPSPVKAVEHNRIATHQPNGPAGWNSAVLAALS